MLIDRLSCWVALIVNPVVLSGLVASLPTCWTVLHVTTCRCGFLDIKTAQGNTEIRSGLVVNVRNTHMFLRRSDLQTNGSRNGLNGIECH